MALFNLPITLSLNIQKKKLNLWVQIIRTLIFALDVLKKRENKSKKEKRLKYNKNFQQVVQNKACKTQYKYVPLVLQK